MTFPHGHWLHECKSKWYDTDSRTIRPSPDFPIRIERVGGGASPIGYAAFVWPDEIHTAALMSNDSEDEPIESWTEPDCLWRAIYALLSNTSHRLGEPFLLDFPPKGKYTEQLMLSVVMCQAGIHAGAFERAAFNHDVDDVCLAITNGGLTS